MSFAIVHDLHFWVKHLLRRGCPASPGGCGAPFVYVVVDCLNSLEFPELPEEW